MNRIKLFTKFGHDIFSWHLREKNIVIKKLKWIEGEGAKNISLKNVIKHAISV